MRTRLPSVTRCWFPPPVASQAVARGSVFQFYRILSVGGFWWGCVGGGLSIFNRRREILRPFALVAALEMFICLDLAN